MKTLMKAIEIAGAVHKGQKDKAGLPYIFHPLRVSGKIAARGFSEDAQVAGILHDVLEDSNLISADVLLGEGIPESVIALLIIATRGETETYAEYIQRIVDSNNMEAIALKMADILDNLDPVRVMSSDIDDSLITRYTDALEKLNEKFQELKEKEISGG